MQQLTSVFGWNSGISSEGNPQTESPFYPLPDELKLEIFSYLDSASFGKSHKVCKQWNQLLKDKQLTLPHEQRFENQEIFNLKLKNVRLLQIHQKGKMMVSERKGDVNFYKKTQKLELQITEGEIIFRDIAKEPEYSDTSNAWIYTPVDYKLYDLIPLKLIHASNLKSGEQSCGYFGGTFWQTLAPERSTPSPKIEMTITPMTQKKGPFFEVRILSELSKTDKKVLDKFVESLKTVIEYTTDQGIEGLNKFYNFIKSEELISTTLRKAEKELEKEVDDFIAI